MVAIGSELEWLFGLEHQSTKLSANNVRSQSGNFGGWILENGHPCRLTAAFERRETSSMWCRLWKELSGEVTTATDKEYVETLARKPSRKQPICYLQSFCRGKLRTNGLWTLVVPSESRVSRSETTEVDGGDWNVACVEKTMVEVEISLNIVCSSRWSTAKKDGLEI